MHTGAQLGPTGWGARSIRTADNLHRWPSDMQKTHTSPQKKECPTPNPYHNSGRPEDCGRCGGKEDCI